MLCLIVSFILMNAKRVVYYSPAALDGADGSSQHGAHIG